MEYESISSLSLQESPKSQIEINSQSSISPIKIPKVSVQKILEIKGRGKKSSYLVQVNGQRSSTQRWLNHTQMESHKNLIDEFSKLRSLKRSKTQYAKKQDKQKLEKTGFMEEQETSQKESLERAKSVQSKRGFYESKGPLRKIEDADQEVFNDDEDESPETNKGTGKYPLIKLDDSVQKSQTPEKSDNKDVFSKNEKSDRLVFSGLENEHLIKQQMQASASQVLLARQKASSSNPAGIKIEIGTGGKNPKEEEKDDIQALRFLEFDLKECNEILGHIKLKKDLFLRAGFENEKRTEEMKLFYIPMAKFELENPAVLAKYLLKFVKFKD